MALDSNLKSMNNQYLLHIETATKNCSVALSCDGVLLDFHETHSENFIHGEWLTVFIQELMQRQSLQFSDLSGVSISSGPGSYTGLRIGLSTAKGLCFALNIPLIALSTLSLLTESVRFSYPASFYIPMIDARRMEVFAAVFNASGHLVSEPKPEILDPESFFEFEPFLFFGDGAIKAQEIWGQRNVSFIDISFPSAQFQVRQAWEKFKLNQFEDLAYFTPEYVKAFHSTAVNQNRG
jgi:tRNA threonylcarbamoyladenosine biosynthesis protein TsaB